MGLFDYMYKSLTEDECVQNPLMHSIGAGTAVAVLYFVGTGMAVKSMRLFLYVTIPVGLGSSMLCRYNKQMEQLKSSHFRSLAKYRALTEGTEFDINYMENLKKRSD